MPGNPAIRGLTARSQEPQQHSGGHPRQLDVLYPGASGKTAADRTRKRTLTATVSTTVDASGGGGGPPPRPLRRAPLDLSRGARHGGQRPRPARRPRPDLAGHRAGRQRRTADGDNPAAGQLQLRGDGGRPHPAAGRRRAGRRARRALLDGGDLRILHRPGHRPVRVRRNGQLRRLPVPGQRGLMDRIRFGAAYYAEYQHRPDLEADFELMVKAGFSVIRVGESVWSTWEPEDGRFELDWLEPVLDAAHRHDIGVILGTPTYAVPMWLTRRYPEIAAETASGHRVGWGARQEVNFAHAAYRFHAERVIRQGAGRYRGHPAITGYQVDDEPGFRVPHTPGVLKSSWTGCAAATAPSAGSTRSGAWRTGRTGCRDGAICVARRATSSP